MPEAVDSYSSRLSLMWPRKLDRQLSTIFEDNFFVIHPFVLRIFFMYLHIYFSLLYYH